MKYPFTIRGPAKTAIRHRLLVEADSYPNALERVLALNPNKFVTIKFAKQMDYLSAMKEVVKQSRKDKKTTYYVLIDDEGECSISTEYHPTNTKAAYKNGSEIALPVDGKETENLPKANKRSVKNPNTLSEEESAFIKYFGLKGHKPELADEAIKTAERLQKLGYLVLHGRNVELTKKGEKLAEQLNKRQKPEDPIKQTRKTMSNNKKEKAMKKSAKKVTKKASENRPAIKGVKKELTVKELIKIVEKGNQRAYNEANKPLPLGYLSKMKDPQRKIKATLVAVE